MNRAIEGKAPPGPPGKKSGPTEVAASEGPGVNKDQRGADLAHVDTSIIVSAPSNDGAGGATSVQGQTLSPANSCFTPGTISTSEYYQRLRVNDPQLVLQRLKIEVTQETEKELYCSCPRHLSESGASLHVRKSDGIWKCFSCGVGGDLLQLVEFAQSGVVTRGVTGMMPESHRAARALLAEIVGLPPLEKAFLSAGEAARYGERLRAKEHFHKTLLTIVDLYHRAFMACSEVRDWFRKNYAISDETIARLKIGYGVTGPWTDTEGRIHPDVADEILSEPYNFTRDDLISTGFFLPGRDGGSLYPFFRKRIVFPYWHRGNAEYAIARQTPWMQIPRDENGKPKHVAKYLKLRVHGTDHPEISQFVDNRRLFNEEVLDRNLPEVVITEGITDAICLIERGIPTVSPVTVRFAEKDQQRILEALRRVPRVYIALDTEFSNVGGKAAMEMAEFLVRHGKDVRIIRLPFDDEQQATLRQLENEYGLRPGMKIGKAK